MATYKFNELFETAQKIDKVFKDIAKDSQIIHDNLKKLKGSTSMKDLQTATTGLNTAQTDLIKNQKELNTVRKKSSTLNKKAEKEADKITQSLDLELQTKKELLKLDQRLTREKAKSLAEQKRFGKTQKGSINDLKAQNKELTRLRNNVAVTSKKYTELTAKLRANNVALQKTQAQSKAGLPGIVSYNSAIGKGIAKLKDYAKGMLGIAAAFAALRKLQQTVKEYVQLAKDQILVETKLGTVLKQRTNANDEQVKSILDLTKAQQRLGVIGDEVQIAGAQQFSTFVKSTDSVKKLIPALNNLLAQQKGLNATQADAVNIANLAGRAFQGQLGSLTRVGISFDEAQGKILKYGTESEKAAALADIITQNVGEMNKELAATDIGQIQQMNNEIGDMKEQIGKELIPIITLFKNISVSAFKDILDLTKDLTAPIRLIKDISDSVTIFGGELTKTKESINKFKNGLRTLISPIRLMIKWTSLLIQGIRRVLQWLNVLDSETDKRFGKVKKRVSELQKEFAGLSKELKQKVIKDFQKLTKEFKDGKISPIQYANSLNDLIIKARLAAETIPGLTGDVKDLNKELTDLIKNATSAGAIAGGGGAGEGVFEATALGGLGGTTERSLQDDIKETLRTTGAVLKVEGTKEITGIQAYFKQLLGGDGSLLSRIFGGGEDGEHRAEIVVDLWQRTLSAVANLIDTQLVNVQNLLSKQDEQIAKTEELLQTELDRINELKAAGAAFDLTEKQRLEKRLVTEEAARQKTLANEKALHIKQQRIQVAQAVMDVASSILNAWKSGEWIENLIETAVITGIGAINIATIKSQKFAGGTDSVQLNGASAGIDTVNAKLTAGEMVVQNELTKQLPKGFTRFMIPDAAHMYMNNLRTPAVYMNDNTKTNSYLSQIEQNTQQNKVYDSNGILRKQIIGNVTNYYGVN